MWLLIKDKKILVEAHRDNVQLVEAEDGGHVLTYRGSGGEEMFTHITKPDLFVTAFRLGVEGKSPIIVFDDEAAENEVLEAAMSDFVKGKAPERRHRPGPLDDEDLEDYDL